MAQGPSDTMTRLALLVVLILRGQTTMAIESLLTDVVYTRMGPIQGEILYTVWNRVAYSSFKGVPYARPPVSYLRFKPPVPLEPWNETRLVIEEGSECMQIDPLTKTVFGSEDCLYFNIYTPQTMFHRGDSYLRSVMVWIHGGFFKQGYSNSSCYGPDFFIEEDVVLVTTNYRVGAFGFLSVGHVNASGNAGLKDQVLVLRLVQENIAYFGGDPNRVTIFGESAGGVSVELHSLSPSSKGLFRHSISQSGVPLCPWAIHMAESANARAHQLGAILGFMTNNTDDLLDFLYKQSAKDIVLATQEVTLIKPPFKPAVEDSNLPPEAQQFLIVCPIKLYKACDYKSIPKIVGFNAHEGNPFGKLPSQGLARMRNFFDRIERRGDSPVLKTLGTTYWLDFPLDIFTNAATTGTQVALDVVGDIEFVMSIDYTQKLLSKCNKDEIFYYRLSYDSLYAPHRTMFGVELNGTAHYDDVGYLFHTPIVEVPSDPNHPFSIFRKKMVRLWSNFAKYGNPTPHGQNDSLLDAVWPDSRLSGKQLDINEKLTVHNRMSSMNARIFEFFVGHAGSFHTDCGLFHSILYDI